MKRFYFKEIENKIIGHFLKKGNRGKALKIWYYALLYIKNNIKFKVSSIVLTAINNLKPFVILKKRKRGGTIYQIPYLVQNKQKDNSTLIAIRWLVNFVYLRSEINLSIKLAKELIAAFNKEGATYKNKIEIYALAIKNKMYTKFLFSKKKKNKQKLIYRRNTRNIKYINVK